MTVTTDQTGLSKPKLKKGDRVVLIEKRDVMCLVERNGQRFWINEKYLSE